MQKKESPVHPQWSQLLQDAVSRPGMISDAYSRFHGYSLGNRIAALFQCFDREIQPGPIASFMRWKELGRSVRKGEKAIVLCQPVTVKAKSENGEPDTDSPEYRKFFIWRPHWFVMSQTEGAEYVPPALPTWDRSRALASLQVEEIPFSSLDGNVQGYAIARSIAINPVAAMPVKTTFHELAHVTLGHTMKGQATDSATLPRELREVEAEAVALLCLESLGLPGSEFCRGYIQNWYSDGRAIPESSASRIFGAADEILRAGVQS